MVTLIKYGNSYNVNVMKIDGLSTAQKPTGKIDGMAIPNGSVYTEIDTNTSFRFDAENKTWHKISNDYVTLDDDGFIPIEYIPPEIIERMYTVTNDTARFTLTTDEVQNGDVVYVNSTQIMYLVKDDTRLSSEAGYKEFAAGIAGRAIADEDGRNIKNTYLTEEEYNAGKTVPKGTTVTFRGQTYTVEDNAEIFNNYNGNIASGANSHAEGVSTGASGSVSHAEGAGTWASGAVSHAEGSGTTASGSVSHAEGGRTTASGEQSHAEGSHTIASSDNQHVEGKFNIEDANEKFAHIIGNGTDVNNRSNAFAIDWDGKIYTRNSATGFDINSSYLEMPNGIRLYISDTEPTGTIPEGSLGIGF